MKLLDSSLRCQGCSAVNANRTTVSLARSQKKQSPALLKNEAVPTQPIGKTHAEGEGLAAGKRRGHSGLSSSSASCAASTTLALCKPTDMDLLRYSSIASSSTRSQKPTSPENLNPKKPHLQVSEHLFAALAGSIHIEKHRAAIKEAHTWEGFVKDTVPPIMCKTSANSPNATNRNPSCEQCVVNLKA